MLFVKKFFKRFTGKASTTSKAFKRLVGKASIIGKASKKLGSKASQNLQPEEDLYALEEDQLKELLEKNISFDFFQLKALDQEELNRRELNPGELNPELLKPTEILDQSLLKKAKLRSPEEIVLELKNTDLKHPIVLICPRGEQSQSFSQELRDKGFINVYFVKKGFQSLS